MTMKTANERTGLLRQAAELGPGYLGKRRESSFTEREALAQGLGEESPPYLLSGSAWIERRAKLFEAGEYPDKGVTVTPEHLTQLATSFDLPVPVLIEHSDSPLELGYLTAVEHAGNDLFGTLALTTEANALVERSGARSLSLGLAPDLTEIREVSLVRNPRVASAQLYTAELVFEAELDGEAPTPNPLPQFPDEQDSEFKAGAEKPRDGANEWQRKFHDLQRQRQEEDADRRVAAFVAEGRLTPAQVPFARALLVSEDTIEFDGEKQPLAHLLVSMIQRQPPHQMFGERTPAPSVDYSSHLMMPEEVEFYNRHFPGVSLDEIAKKRS